MENDGSPCPVDAMALNPIPTGVFGPPNQPGGGRGKTAPPKRKNHKMTNCGLNVLRFGHYLDKSITY